MTLPDEPQHPGCVVAVCFLVGTLVAWGLFVRVAHCQDTETIIARTLVSEEGFDGGEGWPSLGAVITRRAREHHDGDLRAAAVALSPRLHASPCEVVTRRWRCHLTPDLSRPRGLHATWTTPRGDLPSRRDAWSAALEAASRIVAGTLPHSCSWEPRAWGSHADVALRLRAGERWLDAGCPGRNRYGRRLVRREVDPE